jgi:hypothetical protein
MSTESPFLRLPAELRNDISALALSSATPLHLRRATSKKKAVLCIPGASLSGEVDFNQLKYANKQLYAETAGLEIKYSDVTIEAGSLLDQPGHQLAHWLFTITANRRSWLRTITLCHKQPPRHELRTPSGIYDREDPSIPEATTTMAKIAAFCNGSPNIKVRYILPRWRVDGSPAVENFFLDAMYYTEAFRGHDLSAALIPDPRQYANPLHRYLDHARQWRQNIRLEDPQSENLIYLPTNVDELKEVGIPKPYWFCYRPLPLPAVEIQADIKTRELTAQ